MPPRKPCELRRADVMFRGGFINTCLIGRFPEAIHAGDRPCGERQRERTMGREQPKPADSGDASSVGESGTDAARAKARKSKGRLGDVQRSQVGQVESSDTAPNSRLLVGLKQAANLIGYTPTGLRKIVDRSRDKASGKTAAGPVIRFFQTCKSAPIKFKIEWIEEFIRRYSVDPEANAPGPRGSTTRRTASGPTRLQGQYDHGF